jgi:hypothetical protein
MASSCNMPSAPEFIFELSDEATKHNLAMCKKYNFSLEDILNAQRDSPLGPGKESRLPNILCSVFGLHPLWDRMESILTHGSKWPLINTSNNNRANNVINALTFGNHKGMSTKPDLLKKLVEKDVKYSYSIPIPLESVTKIPGLILAPMNIMAQNTINKFG